MTKEPVRRQFTSAFVEELEVVRERHEGQDPLEHNLVGLAFSGGGIRSATFALGVLEGLKQFGLLKKVHYLSTVSGGGYIGAWLSAACKRHPGWLDPRADWNASVAHLRRYSNYLSPTVGFFSADTWSMFTIWLRNALLVQVTVMLAIACVLLVPRPLLERFLQWPNVGNWRWLTVALFLLGIVGIAGNQLLVNRRERVPMLQAKGWPRWLAAAAVCLAAAWAYGAWVDFDPFHGGEVDYWAAGPIAGLLVLGGFFLQPAAVAIVRTLWPGDDPPEQINYTQGWVQTAVVFPLMATAYLVGAILWGESKTVAGVHVGLDTLDTYGSFLTTAWRYWPFPLSVVFASLWLLSFCSIRTWKDWRGLLAAFGAPFVAVPVLHALLCAIMLLLRGWVKDPAIGSLRAFVWAPPLVAFAFSLTIIMLIGMMGRQSTEGVREWWSRLGAWLGIYGVGWMIIAVAAVYGPRWVDWMARQHWSASLSTAAGWLGTVAAGLFAGRSDSTGAEGEKKTNNVILETIAVVAPFVFIAGLLIGVATALDTIITINSGQTWSSIAGSGPQGLSPFLKVSLLVWAGCIGSLLVMAARVDINEFSLNAFYRNRLVRCYLGATRYGPRERQPQNFTGFDDDDDIKLCELKPRQGSRPEGPLHVVNCALNLGGSSDLALHSRHSASFTLSPLHCGSAYESLEQSGETHQLGYVTTDTYGGRFSTPTLGQAISVSGAAASPNMGYHTSPIVAFLLTVFNVRLGWWFPNPEMPSSKLPSPLFNLPYLFAELFGGADDKSKFLMISDGGHFENLAAYELIRRRCRVIIISDGECDPQLRFEGLGTLMRMCEVDFGTRILLDVGSIRPSKDSPWSVNRCAAGRIVYGPGVPDGVLIYLKASMTGHEDTAVLQYKASHHEFPHETTGDQFYGEDQFESYRRLGREIAIRAFDPVSGEDDIVAAATRLLDICSPTLERVGRFTEHSERVMKVWEQLASNPALQSLDKELVEGAWPDDTSQAFRSAFYICSEMIQLMENVYLDLSLEDTWEHPDNSGWRTTFLTWTQSPVLRRTWAMTCGAYGLRFQYFCERHFGLPTHAGAGAAGVVSSGS